MDKCKFCLEPFEKINERLNKFASLLEAKQRTNPHQVFFDNQEFIQIMNISTRTSQSWRDNQIIGFSQIGHKFYYRLSDILQLLDNYYKPSKSL